MMAYLFQMYPTIYNFVVKFAIFFLKCCLFLTVSIVFSVYKQNFTA